MINSEVKRTFNPEFLNRLDEIILFDSLLDEDLEKIVDLLIGTVNEVIKQKRISIVLQPEVRKWIVEKTCHDRSYGARPLRRAIQKYIEDPLSEGIIRNRIKPDAALEIFLKDNSLYYKHTGQTTGAEVKLLI